MKAFLKSLFSESNDVSCMRVMAMLALLAAIGLAIAGKDVSVPHLLLFAGGGKVLSKFAEK